MPEQYFNHEGPERHERKLFERSAGVQASACPAARESVDSNAPPLSPRLTPCARQTFGVRACVIFNPVAKGDKARHFRETLDVFAAGCALKKTAAAGDARRLAAEAIREGFELVIAAGGDGTLNEVLNGMGDAPDGFDRACLGVLPLGTVNVFARELKLPLQPEAAWAAIRDGRETRVDLPCAEFTSNGRTERRYFAQMGGAGLD